MRERLGAMVLAASKSGEYVVPVAIRAAQQVLEMRLGLQETSDLTFLPNGTRILPFVNVLKPIHT